MIAARLEAAAKLAPLGGRHQLTSNGAGAAGSPFDPAAHPDDLLHAAGVAPAVRRMARQLRDQLTSGHTVAVAGADPSLQLIALLAALEAGHPVLACNRGWWPRERDAMFERLRPTWLLAPDGALRALAPAGHGSDDGRLWLGTAASFGEPSPFGWDREQVLEHWLEPDPAIAPGDTVVVSGEVGHAPSLRFALGALCAGATVRFVDRKGLLAVLSASPVDHLCTTPPLLRRALHQLQRRQRRVAGVGRTVLHQGPWRPHEREVWPELLSGLVQVRVSATEAGGWALLGDRPAPGVTVTVAALADGLTQDPQAPAPLGRLFMDGRATAIVGPEGIRPGPGWDSGDLVGIDHIGRLHWQRRARDHFEADGQLVDPLALEAVLGSHPLVAEVVVAPRPHPELGNIVVAVVVPTDPEWPPFAEDLNEAGGELAPHCRVQALAIVDDVPLNAAGAVHRRLVNYEEAGR